MRIEYTKKFARQYRKLSLPVKQAAEKRESIFRSNPKDHRLKTHKLKGNLKDLWSFSVTHEHRILFEFIEDDVVLFHEIGDHDIYQ